MTAALAGPDKQCWTTASVMVIHTCVLERKVKKYIVVYLKEDSTVKRHPTDWPCHSMRWVVKCIGAPLECAAFFVSTGMCDHMSGTND